MKLSKNYTQVTTVSKETLTQAMEQSFKVGNESYPKQECIIKLGMKNSDPTKFMVFLYFKGQSTYVTSLAALPKDLYIDAGSDKLKVLEKAVLEIKEGKILIH